MRKADIKEPSSMECVMDTEPFTMAKVENTLDNGLKIECMGKEFSTIQTIKLLMKENGRKIN